MAMNRFDIDQAIRNMMLDADELRQHEAMLDLIQKASGGKTVWRAGQPAGAADR